VSQQQFITLTVAAASQPGAPTVSALDGGRSLRIWPTGSKGALISMSVKDWRVLAEVVQAAIDETVAVA